MSRAQTVWAVSAFAAVIGVLALFSFLPFSFRPAATIAGLTFSLIAGAGYGYFLKYATPDAIRRNLGDRKNSPG